MPAVDTDGLMKSEAPRATAGFLRAAEAAHNEAEFRTEAAKVIDAFADVAGLDLHLREEYTLVNGRADAVYNRFVIEYEPPGSLRQRNSYRANQHAIDQLKGYMSELVRRERHKEDRLAGVAFDGGYYIFVRRREGVWHVDDPLEVRAPATERFLRTLASLSSERALIPENLVEDFGEGMPLGRRAVSALYEGLNTASSPRVRALFEQWSRQFSEVCDYEQASKVDITQLARSYGVKGKDTDPFALFFCIHTYYAIVIKVLASQVAHFYLMPKLGTELKSVGNRSSGELLAYLRKLEDGALFRDLGISNFLEGDFFGWHLDAWSSSVEEAVREIINRLADYSLVTLDVDPDTTRDLLKQLYQDLVPKKLRHNLGEYYTPDWLAQRLLNQLEGGRFRGDPKKRLLDPACGSGTFLVLAIKAIREYGWEKTVPEADLLEMILENVVGFDLNPLAVISARTNYLLALGDLLQHRRGEITLPVYLCDSILTPSESKELLGQGGCDFDTAVGPFTVPASLVEARYIDRLAALLEECVKIHLPVQDFLEKVTGALPINLKKDERDVRILNDLYTKILDLDAKRVNGIWARIIKNAFAPLFVGRFDYVAGNPPWVNWEHLPEHYRDRTKPLWERYGLFTLSGWRARMGGSKKDISMLMFYVAVDRYLKPKAKIGFLITQTVFKTEGGGEGFRRFTLGKDGAPLRVLWMDDMSAIKPFEGAANRTAVVIAQEGQATRYPVQVGYWRKRKSGTSLPESAQLEQVTEDICRTSRWEAEPVDDSRLGSPWLTGRPQAIRAIKRVVGPSHYQARAGVCTWLNGVYWVDVVARRPDGLVVIANCREVGKKDVDRFQTAVEAESVYPLLRGQDVSRWCAASSLHIVLAQDISAPSSRALTEDRLKRERPRTYGYFSRFEDQLRQRSGYRLYLEDQAFYSVYDCGDYVFAPWKVVWRQMLPDIRAAVAGCSSEAGDGVGVNRVVVPQHVVTLVPCTSHVEAHYICAQMNSSFASLCNASYGTSKSYGVPSLLKRLPIPAFDVSVGLHGALARVSEAAHKATAMDDPERVAQCEAEIDDLTAELWGLSKTELKDIQDSLADLMA